MLPSCRLLFRKVFVVAVAGTLCVGAAGCSTAGLTDAPLTDSEIRDFLLRSNDFALASDGAGYEAAVAAAGTQREVLVKARAAEVDSMGLAQVKADGEVTLSAIRSRIAQLEGRTLPEEDTRIETDMGKVREAFKGDDKQAITTALSTLDSTVSSVEMAVAEREKPAEAPEPSPGPGGGNEGQLPDQAYDPPAVLTDEPQAPNDAGSQPGGQGQVPGGEGNDSGQHLGGNNPEPPSQSPPAPSPQPPAPSLPPQPGPVEPEPGPVGPEDPPVEPPADNDQP